MITIDSIISGLDATAVNPFLILPTAILLHYTFGHEFKILKDSVYGLPRLSTTWTIACCLSLGAWGTLLRWNRRLSRLALNNNVSDTYDWKSRQELALITGGSGGVGGELAKQLAVKGINVVVLDIMELQYSKPTEGGTISFYKCDLTNYDTFQEVVSKVREEVGSPTLVFANAGIVRGKSLFEASKRDIEMTFAVNNLALIWTIKLLVPYLVEKNHGHFFITASATAYSSTVRMVDYSATKAAALSIYEGLQAELKHISKASKVRCSVICPSIIRTKMFEGMSSPVEFLAPALSPEEVAKTMVDAVMAGESRHIVCPTFIGQITSCIRSWPSWVRVGMQDAASNATQGFKGHDPLKLETKS